MRSTLDKGKTAVVSEPFEIALFYVHGDAGIWTLSALGDGAGVIAPDQLSPDKWLEVEGGMRFIKDRIYSFLDTNGAGDLHSYAAFLLSALTLRATTLPPVLEVFRVEGEASLTQLDRSRIIAADKGTSFALSYLDPTGHAPDKRLSPFFKNVEVPAKVFLKAAVTALDEYFKIVDRLQSLAPAAEKSRMLELRNAWRGWEKPIA